MTAPASLALFAPCDMCGEAAALPVTAAPYLAHCPACASRQAKEDAARVMLEDMGGPVLGAWASFWLRAGLTVEDLEEIAQLFDMSWAAPDYAQRVRRLSLRRLARAHPLPPVEAVTVPPARVGVDFAALPLLTAFYPKDPTPGAPSEPAFFDSAGRRAQVWPGLDTLALTLPDGVRAVLYTGKEGSGPYKPLLPSEPVGLRVPPDLWPAFEVYMSGRDKWADLPAHPVRAKLPAPTVAPVPVLPVLIACRVEAGRAVLLADRAGQVFQHAAPLPCPHSLTAGPRGQVLTLYPEDLTRAASFEVWPDLLPTVRAVFSSPEGAAL